MRPLELSFANVRSYASFGLVVFDGRSLVGIVLATRAPANPRSLRRSAWRYTAGAHGVTGTCRTFSATYGAPHMSVDLKFAHEGQSWRVRRTYYANTRPTMAALENLEPATRWRTN